MEYVVYSITTVNDGKRYFGRSQEFEKRRRSHLNMLRTDTHANTLLQQNFNEYGESNIRFDILHVFDNLDDAIRQEQAYIDDDSLDKYNISSAINGGDTFTNNPRKEEIRALRILQSSGKNNPMYQKPKTQKMIDAVKKANSKKIVVDGTLYSSVTEYSKASGVKVTAVCYRLKSPNFPNYKYAG